MTYDIAHRRIKKLQEDGMRRVTESLPMPISIPSSIFPAGANPFATNTVRTLFHAPFLAPHLSSDNNVQPKKRRKRQKHEVKPLSELTKEFVDRCRER